MKDKLPRKRVGKESKTELRRRAEKEHESRTHGREELASADKDNLLHELGVHQIELEMQNDELRRAQQEAQESRNRYLDLFDFAPVGYFVLDRHFLILEANLTGSRMLGVERHELTGQRFSRFIVPAFQDSFHSFMVSAPTPAEQSLELKIQKIGREVFYAELRTMTLKTSGENSHYRVAMTDITQRKQAEENLLRRTSELETSKKELEAANLELESFAYSVSHDLKAPLRAMDGFSEAAIEEYSVKLGKKGKDYLERVRTASQTMARLIEDLLKLSRVSRADFYKQRVDLTDMVQSISEELKATQPERQVEFIIQPGLCDQADRQLLKIALRNLLENSWKYTRNRRQSQIEFGSTVYNEIKVYYLKDNGIGFDMKYADKLFRPFSRLHSDKEFQGTGIGLATVQRIIKRHGGRIWAESETGKGATFFFTLDNKGQTN